MKFACPTCRRTFDEAGFCPYDRTALSFDSATDGGKPAIGARAPLVSAADQRTVQSGELAAALAPKGTLPLTRSNAAVVMPVSNDTKTDVKGSPAPRFQAVSAAKDADAALAQFSQARDEYDSLIGQTLDGRYYIDRKIGEGGMGVVFAARHAVIERPLAIKVLKREVMRDTATTKRFEQEAKAASRIGHPNIVDVTDFGTTPTGMTYQVMEYVKGETLGQALRKSAPFPLGRIVRVGTQIARALGAAHDKGIVHRDLKPENVFLVDRDGREDFVKIVDFGIAKILPTEDRKSEGPKLTRAGSVFGTPEYMAPEQASGRSDIDGRVDLYALGVLLYEMTTGRVPHRGESMVRTLAMVMLEPVEPPSKVRPDLAIPGELEAVIMKALAKKREDRYAKMSDLLAALDGLQVPVGLSLTGSPVYALVPLPPGADLVGAAGGVESGVSAVLGAQAVVPAPKSAQSNVATPVLGTPVVSTRPGNSAALPVPVPLTGQRTTPRPRPLTKGRLHEPEFVVAEKPVTFEHVFTEDAVESRSRRWPLLVLGALVLGGAGGAFALVMKRRAERVTTPTTPPVAVVADAAGPAPVGADAAVVAVVADAATLAAVDAGVAVDAADLAVVVDAADLVAPPVDAAPVVALVPDAGTGGGGKHPKHPDAGVGVEVVHSNRMVRIQVITKPEGGALYIGTTFKGPDHTNIDLQFGTKATIICKSAGYNPGTVNLVFDGKTEVAMCIMHRDRNAVCVPDLKNPFDDCQPQSGSGK